MKYILIIPAVLCMDLLTLMTGNTLPSHCASASLLGIFGQRSYFTAFKP